MKPVKVENDPKNIPPETKVKPAKPPKVKKVKEAAVELPLLVEIGFDFAKILLLLTNAAVLWISLVSGATWTDIFIRIVVTTVVLGGVLWVLSMTLSSGALEAARKYQEEEQKKDQENSAQSIHDSLVREA